jgi:class 3 adenylate cyclase
MRVHHATNSAGDGNENRPHDQSLLTQTVRDAEKLLGMGEPLLAYNLVEQALLSLPDELRLQQLQGLALARSGALRRANGLLTGLRDAGHTDGETLGLLARTHKDLALAGVSDVERKQHLRAAFEIYSAGYHESEQWGHVADAYYTGINTATMAFLLGDNGVAKDIATRVEQLCEVAMSQCEDDASAYWPQATLAEAALIRGDKDLARKRYAAAARLAGTHYGNLSSTRHQARLLLEHVGESATWLDGVLDVPPVLDYTGHMIDAPGRAQARFEASMEGAVRDDILARLEKIRPAAAYGSAACGADILCLECVRELGGELHIILPFPVEHFRETSVDMTGVRRWSERFDKLLEDANEVLVISERPPAGNTSIYEYANLIITGLARLRSQMLDTQLQGLAVWDGVESGDPGGTSSVVSLWRQVDVPIDCISIGGSVAVADLATTGNGSHPDSIAVPAPGAWPFKYSIEAMMFTDAVGYTRLSEEQIPLFVEHYLGRIAELTAATSHRAVHTETAGDGMYMVFDNPFAAAHYALELSELINRQDWQSCGLPEGLGVRIALHSGPVFVGEDPITRQPLYSGIHTSRTARIEPITPPGQVYASSAFAAVATAYGVKGLRFSYIGRTKLAKDYGVLPLYHVKRGARSGAGVTGHADHIGNTYERNGS